MEEWIIKVIETTQIGNLIATGAMFWFGYNRLCTKIDKAETGLGARMDKMQETLTDVDRRLCRLEGAFQSKDCCLLKSDSQHKTAE